MSINNIMYAAVLTMAGGMCGGAHGYLYSNTRQSRDDVTYGNIFFVKYGYILAGTIAGGLAGNAMGRLLAKK